MRHGGVIGGDTSVLRIGAQELALRNSTLGQNTGVREPEEGVGNLRIETRTERLVDGIDLIEIETDGNANTAIARVAGLDQQTAPDLILKSKIPLLVVVVGFVAAIHDHHAKAGLKSFSQRGGRRKNAIGIWIVQRGERGDSIRLETHGVVISEPGVPKPAPPVVPKRGA